MKLYPYVSIDQEIGQITGEIVDRSVIVEEDQSHRSGSIKKYG